MAGGEQRRGFVEVLRLGEIQVGHISKKFGAIAGIDLLPGGCRGVPWGKVQRMPIPSHQEPRVHSFLR